jgi:uncharacterized protein
MNRFWMAFLLLPCIGPGAVPALVDAARHQDRVSVRKLIQEKTNVNATAADGYTALHWAAYNDDVETGALLIRGGANVMAANRYGVTPLSLACTNGSADMAGLLLKSKADPNSILGEGETALMTAARSGNVELVKLLISHGANVNAKETWRGQTALMWAAAEGHVPVIDALHAAGAEINARSKNGFTPFLFAVRQGQAAAAATLLKAGASVNEALPPSLRRGTNQGPGSSALLLAVANAHFELACNLLDAGADPNYGVDGWTALHIITAVRKPGTGSNDPAPEGSGRVDSLEMVRRLAAHGANLNAQTKRSRNIGLTSLNTTGATPFLLAARTADAELMRLLVKLGADPLIPTAEKTTPLMVAAGVGTRSPGEDAGTEAEVLEAVKLALELGNDVNAVDDRGETAIHGAAYKHVASVAQVLLDHGAKVEVWNTKNRSGWTPLRIADGVHRGMNLRQSPETAAVLRKFMSAAGVSTIVEPEAVISGATK